MFACFSTLLQHRISSFRTPRIGPDEKKTCFAVLATVDPNLIQGPSAVGGGMNYCRRLAIAGVLENSTSAADLHITAHIKHFSMTSLTETKVHRRGSANTKTF